MLGGLLPVLLSGEVKKQKKAFRVARLCYLACFFSMVVGFNAFISVSAYASNPQLEKVMDDLYSDNRYQKELPLDLEEIKVEKKAPLPPKPKKKENSEKLDLSALEFLGKILLYGFLMLVIVLAGKAIFNYLQDLKRRPQNKAVLNEKPTSSSRVSNMPEELSQETLEYADQLAQKGQFEAAIRALLFCCLKHVRESYYSTLPAALTNREILQADWLPPDVRQKLSVIIDAEEITEFGGRSAGAHEFQACKEAFHVFVRPKRSASLATEGGAL